MNLLEQPVTTLKGIGQQTALRLQKLGIHDIQDLLFHLPQRYEDRTCVHAISSLAVGMSALVCGKVEFIDVLPRGRKSLICKISDDTGAIFLRFFNFTANQHQAFKPDTWLSAFAEVRYGYAGLEMIHPEYTVLKGPSSVTTETHLTPVYPLTEGLSQQVIRKAIKQALQTALNDNSLPELIPEPILARFQYPSLEDAIKSIHAPDKLAAPTDGQQTALKRLAFEELLAHHLSLKSLKNQAQQWRAPVFHDSRTASQHFLDNLPFRLTSAQHRVTDEISSDCQKPYPMMRLVQGDVGSGKTVVAAYSAVLALAAGYQVALLAPTELLAEQHYHNFKLWFRCLETNIVLLTGQHKGKTRSQTLQAIAEGWAGIIIGTHAIFQDSVTYHRLGLIIIDEQHRFGVNQRLALLEKGQQTGIRPHQLVMTATPIPRTLAMLQYADLDISIIDELPPGRKPVITSVIPAERRNEVIDRINNWVGQKKQVYWVCTLIEESELLQCQAAEQTATLLTEALPNLQVGLIHGRMNASEKEAIILAFKNHQIDLLVATTVIEVGVDVPDASLMVIENPERLGLSQLHQLRGRVGRGGSESYCLLMYQAPLSDTAKQRLGILRDSNDGFVIAEKDLQLRGPGEVMGIRQTGQIHFKIADLARDAELLENIQQLGNIFFTDHANAIQALCGRWLKSSTFYAGV